MKKNETNFERNRRKRIDFIKELTGLINQYGFDTEFETPDFVLSKVAFAAMQTFGSGTAERDRFKDGDKPGVDDCENCPDKNKCLDYIPRNLQPFIDAIKKEFPDAEIRVQRIKPGRKQRNRK